MAKVTIHGLEALIAELKKFPEAVQARATQTGVRKASAKLRTAFRQAAYAKLVKGYRRTNRLRNSIRSAVGKKARYKGKAWVGLKVAPGESKVLSYYKTLEFGRKAYTGKRRGAVAGSPPLKPFWAKTWTTNRAGAQQIMVEETKRALAFEAGKAAGRARGRAR
jgi:hypothetical protein